MDTGESSNGEARGGVMANFATRSRISGYVCVVVGERHHRYIEMYIKRRSFESSPFFPILLVTVRPSNQLMAILFIFLRAVVHI